MRKILEITEETDKILVNICDAALKAGGMQIHGLVNQLINKIKIEESSKPCNETEIV